MPIADSNLLNSDMASLLLTVGTGIVGLALKLWLDRAREPVPERTFEDRVSDAAHALHEASRVVQDLEREITDRTDAVSRLQEQQKILSVDEDKLKAIALLLSQDSQRESRRATWIGVASNAVFFALGVGVTLIVG